MTDKQICDRIRGALSVSMMPMEMELECNRFLDRRLNGGWIPVTEKLPERFQTVIVCRDNGKVEQGYRDTRDWWKVYGTRTKQVTHWMPLPAAPMEVAE